MTETECHYAQIENAAPAITWACEKFCYYILGKLSSIENRDEKALVPLLGTKYYCKCSQISPQTGQLWLLQWKKKYLYTADTISRAHSIAMLCSYWVTLSAAGWVGSTEVWMNFPSCLTIPMNVRSFVTVVGAFISLIAEVFGSDAILIDGVAQELQTSNPLLTLLGVEWFWGGLQRVSCHALLNCVWNQNIIHLA